MTSNQPPAPPARSAAFTVTVKNQGPKNVYVQSARLNGKLLTRPFLPVSEVMSGGALAFVMGARPARR